LEKVISALQERKKSPTRLTKSSKLFKTIINAVKEKKAEEVISLDLKKIDEAVADYFVLCEAKSHVQVKAIADYVVEQVEKECGERPFHKEYGDTWTLVDYVNIVVHVFQHEQRMFYNLEALWEDAPRTEH